MPLALLATSHLLCILHLFIITCMSLLTECSCDTMATRSSHQKIDVRDRIVELQCYAKCDNNDNMLPRNESAFSKCQDKCRVDAKKFPRPGNCPNERIAILKSSSPRPNALSCDDFCNYDFDCPETQKCCPNASCDICMKPIGYRDVPPIPKILNNRLRGHKVEITFATAVNATCLYHVEIRSHYGSVFSPRKLGAWHWRNVEKTAEILDTHSRRIDITFNIKPGRFYQVRVAAINGNGFAGYSEPSKPFTNSNYRPRPPKAPVDLKVVSATTHGEYMNVKIVWCPSRSNQPVDRYKITWSLYVRSKGESYISNECSVKNAHQYVITGLLPDSTYYIQVQAMVLYRGNRWKSEKTSYLYNTTTTQPYVPLKCSNGRNEHRNFPVDYETTTEKSRLSTYSHSNQSYEVHFLMNRKLGMIVRISGFHPQKEKVYELCRKETNCAEYSAIRAKKNSLEFSKLKYNTTYMLKPFQAHEEKNHDASRPFYFTTPKCEKFSKKYPKMQIQC